MVVVCGLIERHVRGEDGVLSRELNEKMVEWWCEGRWRNGRELREG